MIRLDTTSSKLTAVLGGAVSTTQPSFVVSFNDRGNIAAGFIPGGAKTGALNSAVAVDICDSPSPATVREVDHIAIRNNDTASITLTISMVVGSTTKLLQKVTLLTLQSLCYTVGGWQVFDASGNLKQ